MRFGFRKSLVITNLPALRLRVGLWIDERDGKLGREVRLTSKEGEITALGSSIYSTTL